ncbi:hypothetical protein BC835DRAFT_1318939 [Cytidiella melzeri]|nr:hypothetical protein BC835DRAFT_1318939 [Cytidiella melzeri]
MLRTESDLEYRALKLSGNYIYTAPSLPITSTSRSLAQPENNHYSTFSTQHVRPPFLPHLRSGGIHLCRGCKPCTRTICHSDVAPAQCHHRSERQLDFAQSPKQQSQLHDWQLNHHWYQWWTSSLRPRHHAVLRDDDCFSYTHSDCLPGILRHFVFLS